MKKIRNCVGLNSYYNYISSKGCSTNKIFNKHQNARSKEFSLIVFEMVGGVVNLVKLYPTRNKTEKELNFFASQ